MATREEEWEEVAMARGTRESERERTRSIAPGMHRAFRQRTARWRDHEEARDEGVRVRGEEGG